MTREAYHGSSEAAFPSDGFRQNPVIVFTTIPMMKRLILIPARGGSTRVRDKNLRDLGGKPLLATAALRTASFRSMAKPLTKWSVAWIGRKSGRVALPVDCPGRAIFLGLLKKTTVIGSLSGKTYDVSSCLGHEILPDEAFDIDEEDDFVQAAFWLGKRRQAGLLQPDAL